MGTQIDHMAFLREVAHRLQAASLQKEFDARNTMLSNTLKKLRSNISISFRAENEDARQVVYIYKKLLNEKGFQVAQKDDEKTLLSFHVSTKVESEFEQNHYYKIITTKITPLGDNSNELFIDPIRTVGNHFDSESKAYNRALSNLEKKIRNEGVMNTLELTAF